MLRVIEHQELETLYLAVALIDLYKSIQEAYLLDGNIKLKDLTNYLCDVAKFGKIIYLDINQRRR